VSTDVAAPPDRASGDDPELARQLNTLAQVMLAANDGEWDPERIVHAARTAIGSADSVSLTYIRGHDRPRTLAATDELSAKVDAIQYDLGEGPCLEAIAEDDITRSDDLAVDPAWPRFGPAAAEAGAGSCFGVRLFLNGDHRGALNVYARNAHSFNDVDIAAGTLIAAYANQALRAAAHLEQAQNLERALQSNRQIGAAVGILMARNNWTYEEAFENIRSASQRVQRKLRDIAEEVRYTGQLPDH
jgi:transcriptional regulator with GAF, ATPase, and Fis domain